jgi:glycosyltransferase involved in cell wall biosynthesis
MSKVGIVAVSRPEFGGTFQYTLSMIAALRLIPGNEYRIYTESHNYFYDNLGLEIIRFPGLLKSALAILQGRLGLGADAGFFPEVEVLIAPIYTTRLLVGRRPFAFTIHDLQERYYPQYFSLAKRVWRNWTNRTLSRKAAAILCESKFVKSDISKFLSVDGSKISVIVAPPVSEFSDMPTSAATPSKITSTLKLPETFLFYPAQFFPHKNHMRLVDAFAMVLKQHPDCHLYLTGKKLYEYTKVMDRVAQLNISGRVTHLGYVDIDTLASVYRRATAVVVPTLFESVSIPIYEAFHLGVAVCASNVVALPEQVGDAGILFDPCSLEGMAKAMCDLLSSSSLRRGLIERGRRRVALLTQEDYSAQLAVLLQSLQQ